IQLKPMPTTSFEVEPTSGDVDFYREHGFLAVERITTDEELEWLTDLYEHIFDPANASDRGAPIDRSTGIDDAGPPLVAQAFMPEFNYPELLQTTYNRNARRFAAALLDVDIDSIACWSHMIRKLPGGRAAPWHQDEAYWEPELEYHALGCWLPLHDVSEEMGTMQFVPGSHRRGVLPHHAKDGDVQLHLLTVDVDVDTSSAVACPLTAGGCTFHHARTLHYTAPNATGRPRLAWPTEFEVMPRRRDTPAERPWVDDWRIASGHGAPSVHPRDGVLVDL
ncbi:MAG: phytanoyl-CoA dioxygenase family protein, partial [Ilumatobacteraceae bacterium]